MKYYLGLVYYNKDFGSTGCIRVMLTQEADENGLSALNAPVYEYFNKYLKYIMPSEVYEDAIRSEDMLKDCIVLGNLGNAYNSGSISIPQIGSMGLICELTDKSASFGNVRYAWLGGIYGSKKYGRKVMLPNDDTGTELGEEDKALVTEGIDDPISNSDYINKGMYIVKTKTCKIDDYNKVDTKTIDYKNIPGENTFVLKKDKAALRHNKYEEKNNDTIQTAFGELLVLDDKITLHRVNEKDNVKTIQEVTFGDNDEGNNQITITNFNNDKDRKETSFVLDNEGNISVYCSGKMHLTAVQGMDIETDDVLNINAGKGIKINSTENTISISSNGVNFIEVVKNILDFLAQRFTTIGNQATQITAPANIQETNKILEEMLQGFNTTNTSKTVTAENKAKR